ncbi:Leucine-rich repeat domain superfamily [Sesbania bispinosa]|nr:Leucine-rich repeat domain superfamily [Sesbania bispinosa]
MSHSNRSSPILNTRSRLRNDESGDLISKLPDEILTMILSKLHIDEAVRCNVLSKRWEGLWKQTSHIEFDAKHMIMPMAQLLHSRARLPPPGSVLSPSILNGINRHKNSGDSSSSGDHPLSYPMSMFWERLELCNCINQKLKFVYMWGFNGEVQEVELAKYLITRATMMKKITIACNDYSMGVAKNLLSLPRASVDLSINLTYFFNGHFAEH